MFPDERGNRYYFSLVLFGEHWSISGVRVLDWIQNAEKLLENTIQEYERCISVSGYR